MNDRFKKILIIAVVALVVGSLVYMFTISPLKKTGNRKMPDADNKTGELTSGVIIEQKFNNITDNIVEVAVVFSREYELGESTNVVIELLDGSSVLAQTIVNADDIPSNHRTYIKPASPLSGYVGKELTLKIYTDSSAGTGLTVMYDSSDDSSSFVYGGNVIKGTICFSVSGQ